MNQFGTPAPTASQTPLGGLLNEAAASLRAKDPFTWLLFYWLNISTVGTIRGQDPDLLALRIEMEHEKIADPALRAQIQRVWSGFARANQRESMWLWTQMALENRKISDCFDELDRMLVDKGPKTRAHLRRLEGVMIGYLQAADIERAKELFDKIGLSYGKLLQEEAADAIDAREKMSQVIFNLV